MVDLAAASTGLSVIVVNWNTREFLISCLRSVDQRGPGNVTEIFVVDNGSEDGSGEAVRKMFPRVELIENGRNLGFARANNQAIARSRGDYLLLLNPDAVVREGAIEGLMAFMERHPGAGIAGPQLLNQDGSKQNSIANFPSLATELLNKSLLRWFFPERFPGKGREYREPIEVDSVIGACMIVRRQAVGQVGLLDEGYFLFLEETDWCYRMKQKGWKVYHVPQAQVFHAQGQSAGAERARAKVEYYRSRYRFFKKNRGGLQWLLLVVGAVTRLSAELIGTALACCLTLFFVKRWRRKLVVLGTLMGWHLRGCPGGMGLAEPNDRGR